MFQAAEQVPEHLATEGTQGFDAGKIIIEHVSNSEIDHPLIQLPRVLGIDFSVTKHVFMLWLVAASLFVVVVWAVRRYVRQDRLVPTGFMNVLEGIVEFVRDSIVAPNVGSRWANTWTPLILTFFLFILAANAVGLIPLFELLGLLDRWVPHSGEDSFVKHVMHGGSTPTGNFNVTA